MRQEAREAASQAGKLGGREGGGRGKEKEGRAGGRGEGAGERAESAEVGTAEGAWEERVEPLTRREWEGDKEEGELGSERNGDKY